MKIQNISLAVLLISLFLSNACKKNTGQVNNASVAVPEVETQQFRKHKGTDCDSVYEDRTNCAYIDFQYPVVIVGPQALKDSVAKHVEGYLIGILTGGAPEEDVKANTLEQGAKVFFDTHESYKGSAMYGGFTASSGTDVVLLDSQYLSIAVTGDTYQGGAHGSQVSLFATFKVPTGQKLTWDDVVTDKAALKTLAEQHFRKERAEIFKDGFDFDETFQFDLPQNFALTESGIYFHYDPYEVGPYAIGSTTFVLPYSDMGNNLKTALPVPPKATAEDDSALSLYGEQGNDLVLPTFEIEVKNSVKADKTLASKKETIIVSAMFYGFPLNEKDADETGQMGILNKEIELTGNNRVARFEGLKFPKTGLAKLSDKDISLLINVYSGRKSSEDNLLSCGLLDLKASQFGNKRFVIGCQLIEEPVKAEDNAVNPIACYALPQAGETSNGPLSFLVNCDSVGGISFAGNAIKDLDALKAAIRPLLKEHIKAGEKSLPGIETEGCMMGTSGAIRDMYEELKDELTGNKPKDMEKPVEKVSMEKAGSGTSATKTDKTSTSATTPKTATKPATEPAKTTAKSTAKPATRSGGAPTVTLKQNGDMLLNGKAVGSFEALRKQLQAALLEQTTIPDKVDLQTIGETGMGARAEVKTVIDEAIKGAKWVRKKTAIAALNSSVGKKLGMSTQLELGVYQTSGSFAYISAKPKQADGKAVDYSKTTYAKEFAAGKFKDNALGLLQFDKGSWKVLAFNIGIDKAPVDAWVKNFKAPKALFGK